MFSHHTASQPKQTAAMAVQKQEVEDTLSNVQILKCEYGRSQSWPYNILRETNTRDGKSWHSQLIPANSWCNKFTQSMDDLVRPSWNFDLMNIFGNSYLFWHFQLIPANSWFKKWTQPDLRRLSTQSSRNQRATCPDQAENARTGSKIKKYSRGQNFSLIWARCPCKVHAIKGQPAQIRLICQNWLYAWFRELFKSQFVGMRW